ncbi:MAG TPA: type II toxin-antitoxin system VapC family toxin [Candidatus Acidoferrales bacterium]|nr:type II toxin-antitoxin system VapC family toxin [Candidatus Acidoferrales bacterium]
MRILLDTATFLWAVTDAPDLSDDARTLFVDPENEIYLSSVSTWEIVIKNSLGKLPLPEPPVKFVPAQRKQHGIDSLSLDEEATLHLRRLPVLHKDPFDRMLVCQAIVHDFVILTPDELISQYPVRTTW